ncbi:ribosome biogenesis factor YjgA [Reinekea marina]|uniref:Dual-action ribosomal maturation protein DarP n=1 Tax=Reinekea marina TaxID=1310421 RepID=A0ABV7WPC1_9GAMM|nr:ribosome biogenesis factor YjgA [Reinekea marina]MDN3648722.1 ribosome biogenesis factor YjgA [Reinekea marina]
MSDFNDNHYEDDEDWVSKSQVKREMIALQELGEQLINLKASELAKFPISSTMQDAIDESRRVKGHEAMRRHMQYVGKVMRNEDVEGIQRELDKLDTSSELFLRLQNQAERWRERLIKTKEAEAQWIKENDGIDIQAFRSLVRAARKEQPEDPKAPIVAGKSSKKLLQIIRKKLFA